LLAGRSFWRLWQRPCPGSLLAALFLPGLLAACSEAAAPLCTVDTAGLKSARVAAVVDGDTLRLEGGDKVRMIGLNAPELSRDGRPAQPLANAARRQLESLIGPAKQVLLQAGRDSRDRYGRRLAHAFDLQGNNLQAQLLNRGLAFHVAVAPNFSHLECLQDVEAVAREQGLGVWAEPAFATRPVAGLDSSDRGFARVRGRVTRVSFKDNGWWVQLDGRLGLQIKRDAQGLFRRGELSALQGREIEARGWLVPMKGGWWLMNIGHPSMLGTAGRIR
jgi:endonuclease YncB( thermonuclease family)